eukprot:scaffold22146_cov25-Prasinocladus_malaysianus.AAC.1
MRVRERVRKLVLMQEPVPDNAYPYWNHVHVTFNNTYPYPNHGPLLLARPPRDLANVALMY